MLVWYCKYIDKNNEYHDKLYFKDTTFYNNFIENDKIKGNTVLLKEKLSPKGWAIFSLGYIGVAIIMLSKYLYFNSL